VHAVGAEDCHRLHQGQRGPDGGEHVEGREDRREVQQGAMTNRCEYSRTAVSPRASMAARMSSTARRTFASALAFASSLIPVLR